MPVAGIGAGQAAQHHHPRHEAEIGVRFAGRDKLVHLIGWVKWCNAWGEASRIAATGPLQIGQGFTDGNQLAAFTLHGLFSHVPQTEGTRVQRRGG